jgi:hypothetical protein
MEIISAFLVPIILGILSIYFREKVYADRKSENKIMGLINGIQTISGLGAIIGFFIALIIGARSFRSSGAWADMFGPLVSGMFYGFFGASAGFIIGIIVAFLPTMRKIFTINPILYYIPTALTAISFVIYLFFHFFR